MHKGIISITGVMVGLVILGAILIIRMPEEDHFKYPVDDTGIMLLDHSIEIDASPKEIWDFLEGIETNYVAWHPQDHRLFRWESGQPLAAGSVLYSEQVMGGELTKYTGRVLVSIPNRRIVLGFDFPVSIISPKIEWNIAEGDGHSVFTAVTHMKLNGVFRRIFSRQIVKLIEDHDRHVAVEGDNLKRILETERKGGQDDTN